MSNQCIRMPSSVFIVPSHSHPSSYLVLAVSVFGIVPPLHAHIRALMLSCIYPRIDSRLLPTQYFLAHIDFQRTFYDRKLLAFHVVHIYTFEIYTGSPKTMEAIISFTFDRILLGSLDGMKESFCLTSGSKSYFVIAKYTNLSTRSSFRHYSGMRRTNVLYLRDTSSLPEASPIQFRSELRIRPDSRRGQ